MKEKTKQDFVELVQKHLNIIYKICHVYGSSNGTEDLKQEIIYQLWKSFPSFRGESKFTTWMYRVALNTALFELRKHQNTFTRIEKVEHLLTDDSEETVEKVTQIEQLYAHIASLNEIDRGITLLYLEKFSYREIADITGMTEKNVGIRLFRIKNKLKAMFNNQEE